MEYPVMNIFGIWCIAFFTLAIFSFLYRDNPFYKIAEHTFVGVSTGYAFVLAVAQTIKPNFWEPFMQALSGLPEGNWWRLGGGVLGVLLLMRLNRKASWISSLPLALMVGVFAAIRMTGLAQTDLIGQINGTMIPLYEEGYTFFSWESESMLNNFVLIGGVVCVLIYFFFSLERRGIINVTSNIGIYFLMVTFGSSYGFTVMARVSLLIGRVEDLCRFCNRESGYATLVCGMVIFGLLFGHDIIKRVAATAR